MVSVTEVLEEHTDENDPDVEAIILLDRYPPEFKTYNAKMKKDTEEGLKKQNIRLLTYKKLIHQAKHQYKEYFERQEHLGTINKTIDEITQSILTDVKY